MNQNAASPPTLFKLLARDWDTGSPVRSVLFNAEQTAIAFCLADGTLALAETADEDPPQHRIHISADDGRSTIRPRTRAIAPLRRTAPLGDDRMRPGTIGESDFLVIAANGRLVRVSPDGADRAFDFDLPGPVTAFDHCPETDEFACACNDDILLFRDGRPASRPPFARAGGVTDLRFSGDGRSLAIAHASGLTVHALDTERPSSTTIPFSGGPGAVSWSPDGRWVATQLGSGGFQLSCPGDGRTRALADYPAPVGSIAWNRSANALVTSGAFRVAAWSMQTPPFDDAATGALQTGRAGLVPVTALASHPTHRLVAAGYESGALTIVQVGEPDELILNGENHGAVSGLSWSRDGRQIAVGTADGMAAILTLPPQMFK